MSLILLSTWSIFGSEVIRILYRSRERGVILLDLKAGDFASYSLPRLSVSNLEEGQESPQTETGPGHRNESRSGKDSDLSSKSKNFVKSPCLKVKRAKTRPASRKKLRSNGTWAKQLGNHNKVKTDEESFFPVVWLIWSHQSAKRVAKLYLVSKYKEVNPIKVHLCA